MEIEQAKIRLARLGEQSRKIEEKSKKLEVYDTFLNKVIAENGDEFAEPNDIVQRFNTLKEA